MLSKWILQAVQRLDAWKRRGARDGAGAKMVCVRVIGERVSFSRRLCEFWVV